MYVTLCFYTVAYLVDCYQLHKALLSLSSFQYNSDGIQAKLYTHGLGVTVLWESVFVHLTLRYLKAKVATVMSQRG